MAHVLVTGGTGHLGRDLVERLVAAGHRVRVFARTPGVRGDVEWAVGDLATGVGMEAAIDGVDTVINAATFSPIARRGGVRPVDFFKSPSAVDVAGAARLLELSETAGVKHFLHVSIVGIDDASLPYAKVKLEAERLVKMSSVAWSVVRAMPFYYLLKQTLDGLAWLPAWPAPRATFNPVDTSDVAEYLVKCAFDGKRGVRPEIGGPEDLTCAEFERQYQQAKGVRRAIFTVRISEKAARGMGFCMTDGVRGATRWSSWLDRHFRREQSRPTAVRRLRDGMIHESDEGRAVSLAKIVIALGKGAALRASQKTCRLEGRQTPAARAEVMTWRDSSNLTGSVRSAARFANPARRAAGAGRP